MKLSRILELIKQKSGKELKFLKKFDDGFRNDVFKIVDADTKEKLVLIVYKSEKRILRTINNAHAAAKFLSGNFPTRVPIEISPGKTILKITTSSQQKSSQGNSKTFPQRYLALYNFLPGESIPWESYKRRHLKSIGKTLSDMHFYLKKFKWKNLPRWDSEISLEIKEMTKYFGKVSLWIERKLRISLNENIYRKLISKFENYLKKISKAKNGNFSLHYDFVRGNILFSDKILEDDTYEITGIIDFEKVCLGPHTADIARTLSFLIVDCKYKSETEVKKWFLRRGYIKRGKNEVKIDYEELELLLQIFWLRDFYKFLLHNPYESLSENEHYIRTREKLTERNLLTPIM